MDVGDLLDDCLRAAEALPSGQISDSVKLKYESCKDTLCVELASLLEEAMEMKWPFVPEKWQYKQTISTKDKTNLSDLISQNLHQLLDLLKMSIMAQEAKTSLAVIFLVDRFLYWTDESRRLLKITKLLNKHYPENPVAPQLIIRQARVFLNFGKLQKAESILSSLIYKNGKTGCWVYQSNSDKVLVQAVSVQVRGMVLQKLGLWLQAAELIWGSVVGFYSLPQPDKKGIGTSLGLLANILVSMNDEDFYAFKTNPDIDYPSLLGDAGSHRLLSAAQAAKMAVLYSQYTSLYVLTNVTAQGTCLLSYSFSLACPASQRQSILQEAREAFAIGLLTKAEGELVTSQQELHTFLKAAYSITVTDKWLDAPNEVMLKAARACEQALETFYKYCRPNTQDKDGLCVEIMHQVSQVKHLLCVEPFPNSDKGSFIPDSYRNVKNSFVNFTLEDFSKILARFQKYHASLCETTKDFKRAQRDGAENQGLTELNSTVSIITTENFPEAAKHNLRSSDSAVMIKSPNAALATNLKDKCSLGSSWQKFSISRSTSPQPRSNEHRKGGGQAGSNNNQSSIPTETDDSYSHSHDENGKPKPQSSNLNIGSNLVPKSSIPKTLIHSPQLDIAQARIETVLDTDQMTDRNGVETSSSPQPRSSVHRGVGGHVAGINNQSTVPTETDDSCLDSADVNKNRKQPRWNSEIISSPTPKSPRPKSLSHSPQFEVDQYAIDTVFDTDLMTDVNDVENEGSLHSLSQLALKSSSSSFGESFGSQSSWEKISTGQTSPMCENALTGRLSKSRSKSGGSDGSFVVIEAPDSESGCSPGEMADQGKEVGPSPKPQPLESHDMGSNIKTTANLRPTKPASRTASAVQHNPSQSLPDPNAATEENSLEMLELNENGNTSIEGTSSGKAAQNKNALCYSCLYRSTVAEQFKLSKQDYLALLAGICHECLLRRLSSNTTLFKVKNVHTSHNALHLKFSKASGLWTARETCVYIGDLMKMEGKQRRAIWVQFLHQEERLSSYVGKDYLVPKQIQFHLNDVERQMTAQYYVTEFNKRLYDKEVLAQIFYILSDALLILNGDEIVGCITVEPYMLGTFVKLTNNTVGKKMSIEATKYGLAFGHFTYLFSTGQEVVVDLQGWTTSNGKGLTYLTDPQIHTTKTPKNPSNFAERGLEYFLKEQHGPTCNEICNLLKLPPLTKKPHA